jgi:hypothetical protein
MISAVKSLNANFKFDIVQKKLELYPTTGKFDFIISSFAKTVVILNLGIIINVVFINHSYQAI